MSSTASHETSLRELARRWGVANSYRDGLGRRRRVPIDTLVAVLQGLGAPLRSPADAAEATDAWSRERWDGHAEPAVIAWEGRAPRIRLRIPARTDGAQARGLLVLETGKRRALSWNLGDVRISRHATVSGRAFVEKELPLPGPLPLGYHRVTLRAEGPAQRVLVISAPRRCCQPPDGDRRWGVFLPLYALSSRDSWGAGDLTDLRRLVEWTAARGGGMVASLPLLAAFLDGPCEPSPYRPASRLFWNEFYVDASSALRTLGGKRTRHELSDPGFREALEAARQSALVDYEGVSRLKRTILEDLLGEIREDAGPSWKAFRAYVRAHPETGTYARFRAGQEQRGSRRDRSPNDRDGGPHPARPATRLQDYHSFAQWIVDGQMAETADAARRRGVHLYLDLPLGVHPDGFDVSRYPDSFVPAMTVGAPPDAVFTSGQEWGFPPLHPYRTRAGGHEYFRAVLRHHMRFASVLRVDHVMALHRLFWIPPGSSADRGTYVRYPAEELYAILCLESQRSGSIVVGENLGTVPSSVNTSLRRHGISSLYVLHYALESGGEPSGNGIPSESVASLNSHDLPPFASFWMGLDIDDREARGLITHEEAQTMRRARGRIRTALEERLRTENGFRGSDPLSILRQLLVALARSPAWAALVNLEDLWSETNSQNVPGTSEEFPNWRRKSRRSIEEFTSDTSVREFVALVDQARKARRQAQARRTGRTREEGS